MFEPEYLAVHVAGKDNDLADSLSRLQMDCFFQLFPEADRVGSTCPHNLWDRFVWNFLCIVNVSFTMIFIH